MAAVVWQPWWIDWTPCVTLCRISGWVNGEPAWWVVFESKPLVFKKLSSVFLDHPFYNWLLMQWSEGSTVCRFYGTTVGANSSCHDEVDFSLCFEDTAILYGIFTVFWVLAGLSFCRGNGLKPRLDFGVFHASKLVKLILKRSLIPNVVLVF